jgi:hypothetical protein
MEETWTQRADKLIGLLEKVPAGKEGSPEKELQRAVWVLCQKLKDAEAEADGGEFIAPSIMSD